MIAVIDYAMGNLFNVDKALNYLGLPNLITRDPEEVEKCDSVILPGVGAFPDAKKTLDEYGLTGVLIEQAKKKPFLGICLGAQLLFERGEEVSECAGLGVIPGRVRKIDAPGLKIPHMGWNSLRAESACPLLDGVEDGSYVFFVHSYMMAEAPEYVAAYTEYGGKIPAVVQRGSVFGVQFHPEKSGGVGLRILRNFGEIT